MSNYNGSEGESGYYMEDGVLYFFELLCEVDLVIGEVVDDAYNVELVLFEGFNEF
jgi:hypothetical protein